MPVADEYGIYFLWIPLGAGGWFVRNNGRIWEAFHALKERREARDLYHSALQVHVPGGQYVVENAWPIPDARGASRGVVVEGPVFSRVLGRVRAFRYEVRRWPGGTIFDASWAVGGPQRITDDVAVAQGVLRVLPSMPPRVWGRRVPETDDMWNSNSTISWALTRGGFDTKALQPPPGGRAPGWAAGVSLALAEMEAEHRSAGTKGW